MKFLQIIISFFFISKTYCFEIYFKEFSFCDEDTGQVVNCNFKKMHAPKYESNLHYAAINCESLQMAEFYLHATGVSLQVTSAYMACTGIGVSGTVVLSVSGAVISSLSFITKYLPCDKENSFDRKIEKIVEEKICLKLKNMGINCNENLEEEIDYSTWQCKSNLFPFA